MFLLALPDRQDPPPKVTAVLTDKCKIFQAALYWVKTSIGVWMPRRRWRRLKL